MSITYIVHQYVNIHLYMCGFGFAFTFKSLVMYFREEQLFCRERRKMEKLLKLLILVPLITLVSGHKVPGQPFESNVVELLSFVFLRIICMYVCVSCSAIIVNRTIH